MCAEIALEENKMMKHPAIFSRHLRFLLPRYRNHQQISKVQRTARYVIICAAILILFTITIVVHLPKEAKHEINKKQPGKCKFEMKNGSSTVFSTRENVQSLEYVGLDLSNGSEELLKNLSGYYQQGFHLVDLILRDSKHDKNRIEKGWLNLTDTHPKIHSLTLDNKLLEEIGDFSFDVMPQMQEIVLSNTNLKFLKRNAFKDLHEVWSFSLRGNKQLKWVENGLVREFGLMTLQIEGMDFSERKWSEEFFGNLTGNAVLSTLSILELRNNRIPTFHRKFITDFPQLISLYLIQNTIQAVELSSFTPLRAVQLVDITQNELTTFAESTFGYLFNERKTQVFIANNPIACDCSLEWLRQAAIQNNLTKGLVTAECKTPEVNENKLVLEVELCANEGPTTSGGTTVSEGTTTSGGTTVSEGTTPSGGPTASGGPTTSEGTTPSENVVECVDPKTRRTFLISPEITLPLRNHSGMTVEETDSSEDIHLHLNANDEQLALAFVCRECNRIYCETIEKDTETVLIRGLRPSTDYLVCIFGGTEISTGFVDFSDCLAYRTQPSLSERPWLTRGDKNWTIASIALTAFCVFFFGALMAFLVVRMKPSLLKGSGRVEVVKSRNGELVLVMPERRAAPSPSPSSTYDTISGYVSLTPQDKTPPPPPLPPYPPTWFKRNKEDTKRNLEDREYLEPKRLYPVRFPRNKDLLLEYEWYTQQYRQEK